MTRGRQGSGVQVRANDYRCRFTWNGVRYEIPVDLKPSIPHTKHLEGVMRKVRAAVEMGEFTFAKYFPDSEEAKAEKVAAGGAAREPTFGDAADTWKRTRGAPLSAWQQKKDTNYIAFWKGKIGAARVMRTILPSEIEAIVAEHPWPSAKHRNNLLSPLRGIFELWVKDDRKNRVSPVADIVNGKVQKKRPDPFSIDEAERILADMDSTYDPRIGAYFGAAFFSGLRPEEEIALLWTKVDDSTRTAVIDVARTAFADKPTKNYELRTVHFNPRAWAAIQRMRPFTYLKPHGHVFENPRTGEPWASEADQRDLYWNPTLKRLRIRHRTPYKTRATCATMYLMMGKEPGWIARELGHSERVFWESYAETIRQLRHGDEHVDFEAQLEKLKARAGS